MPKMQLQSDLTVCFLTVNKVPKKWADFQMKTLKDAIGDSPIISVSRIPMEFGINLIQTEISAVNIYRQMLRVAKIATTPYVAVAEDDTLYSEEHFKMRPDSDTFSYNMSRWGVLSWSKNPVYYYRHRESNSALIAPRELLIKCLEERFSKYPNDPKAYGEVGKEKVEKNLGLPHYKVKRWCSRIPIINFAHNQAIDRLEQQQRKGENKALIAYEVPGWGRADDIIRYFI